MCFYLSLQYYKYSFLQPFLIFTLDTPILLVFLDSGVKINSDQRQNNKYGETWKAQTVNFAFIQRILID